MKHLWTVLFVCGLGISACSSGPTISFEGDGCLKDSHCDSGLICVDHTCVIAGGDRDYEADSDTEQDADLPDGDTLESDTSPDGDQTESETIHVPEGMIAFPAGDFNMGCNSTTDGECKADEYPRHLVHLDAFAIDKNEVSVERYRACVTAGACTTTGLTLAYWSGNDEPDWSWACTWGREGYDQHPITCLNWQQASDYCNWLGKRLPTEAEWERVARGLSGKKYPWGNVGYDEATLVANIADITVKKAHPDQIPWGAEYYDDGFAGTAPIGSYPKGASPEGALDLIGNAWEWTSDKYSETYYQISPKNNPSGADSGSQHVVRGSSWGSGADWARASQRGHFPASDRDGGTSMRCALSLD